VIDIRQLTEKDIGRWVKYTGNAGEEAFGRIKTWNNIFIFVVYNCNDEWDRFKKFTPSPTNPKCLEFIENDIRESG
jgi:hypothetical protein